MQPLPGGLQLHYLEDGGAQEADRKTGAIVDGQWPHRKDAGLYLQGGKKFAARLKFDDEFKVVFEFDERPRNGSSKSEGRPSLHEKPPEETTQSTSALTCPKCQQGQIIEGQRGFGCNRYREGCDFVVWKEMAGKKLTEKQIHTLIAKGKTGVIKGFKSKKAANSTRG